MKQTMSRTIGLLLICFLLLFCLTSRATATPPPCPDCHYWDGYECVPYGDCWGGCWEDCETCKNCWCRWACIDWATCCGGSCCSNDCCDDVCCNENQYCCSDEICCNLGDSCCTDSGIGDAYCCSDGKTCCDKACCDPETERCCDDIGGDDDGYCCGSAQSCCDGDCCESDECCEDDECVLKCDPDGEPCPYSPPGIQSTCPPYHAGDLSCNPLDLGKTCHWEESVIHETRAKCPPCGSQYCVTDDDPCAMYKPVVCDNKFIFPFFYCACFKTPDLWNWYNSGTYIKCEE